MSSMPGALCQEALFMPYASVSSSALDLMVWCFLQPTLHGLGRAHPEFSMQLALHPLGWTMLSQGPSQDKFKRPQICFHL